MREEQFVKSSLVNNRWCNGGVQLHTRDNEVNGLILTLWGCSVHEMCWSTWLSVLCTVMAWAGLGLSSACALKWSEWRWKEWLISFRVSKQQETRGLTWSPLLWVSSTSTTLHVVTPTVEDWVTSIWHIQLCSSLWKMAFWHLVCSNPGTLLVHTVVDSCFKGLFDVCVMSMYCWLDYKALAESLLSMVLRRCGVSLWCVVCISPRRSNMCWSMRCWQSIWRRSQAMPTSSRWTGCDQPWHMHYSYVSVYAYICTVQRVTAFTHSCIYSLRKYGLSVQNICLCHLPYHHLPL